MKANPNERQAQIRAGEEQFEEDQELIEQIKQGLHSIDTAYEHVYKAPDISELQHMLAQHRAASRRKLRRELWLFWGIAALILASCLLIAISSLMIYGVVQLMVTVIVIGMLLGIHWRERRAHHDQS